MKGRRFWFILHKFEVAFTWDDLREITWMVPERLVRDNPSFSRISSEV